MSTSSAEDQCEVAVVGAGVMGSCTALSLQKKGHTTLLLEQESAGHGRGSSGGAARIIRLANFGPPQLTPIMEQAYQRWLTLSALVGEPLISPAALLMVSGRESNINNVAASLTGTHHPARWLPIDHVNSKYRTRFPSHYTAFEDDRGGMLRADRCLAAVQKLYRDAGGKLLEGWRVTGIEPGTPWVRLQGEGGRRVRARAVVLCPGPWATHVLGMAGITHLPLRSERTKAFLWRATFPHASFVDMTNAPNYHYGLPALDQHANFKVGVHDSCEVSPDGPEPDLSFLKNEMQRYMCQYLPVEADEPVGEELCWYTSTPDGEFILDRHPRHPNIVYGVGFSGRGFKVAPVVGDILAAMALGDHHGYDITPFAAARFHNPNKASL